MCLLVDRLILEQKFAVRPVTMRLKSLPVMTSWFVRFRNAIIKTSDDKINLKNSYHFSGTSMQFQTAFLH